MAQLTGRLRNFACRPYTLLILAISVAWNAEWWRPSLLNFSESVSDWAFLCAVTADGDLGKRDVFLAVARVTSDRNMACGFWSEW